jgi:tetratricopeptide (TPR) repeat protein
MKNTSKYIILITLTFILYGNTLFHDYTLDDALVITENEYTLSGFEGIDDIFSEEFFNGFFDQKDKNLVSGGRYRPLSMVTFAIEWQLVMGSPFKGINKITLAKRMNRNAKPKFILPSQKLLKDLSRTIHTENGKLRIQQQESILNNEKSLTDQERSLILSNLKRMHSKRRLMLFISHLINVLLFALTILILFILLERLFQNYKSDKWYLSIAFAASLLFLAHPIHTEVVANIKGRDEILSLLGALLAALFTVKYIDKQKPYYIVLSFGSFLLALFSKEVAITFLVIIPLCIYFFIEKEKKSKSIIISIIPLFVASVIYFYVRGKVVGGMSFAPSPELMNNSFLGMTFSEKYATIFYTLLMYIKLLIFPHPLTYDYYPYHITIMNWSDIRVILALLVHIGIGIYALIGLKKKRILSFGIFFYLIALSPMSNILFPIGVFMNERFVYAASIGFIVIMAYFISTKLPLWIKNTSYITGVLFVILVLYSVKTISRNQVWENDFTLFTHDVNISENSAKSNTSAGGKLIEEAIKPGNKELKIEYLDKAIFYLYRAIKIHPEYNEALLLMGNAQWERYRSLDSLFNYYNLILERNPKYEKVYSNIFNTKIIKEFDKPEKADQNINVLHKLEKYDPGNFSINYYLGRIYGRYKNNLKLSIQYLEKAAKIDHLDITVFKDLGVAYGMTKEYEKSADALSKAVSLDPVDPVLKINLAMTYANLRKFQEAFEIMEITYNMDYTSKNASVLMSLGNLYKNMGKNEESQQCFLKAQQLNPDLFKNDK